jgi:excisionase family DNA binding protein
MSTKKGSAVQNPENESAFPHRGLRVAEAAAYLGATVYFVRDAVWKNQLPAMKLGRRLIITRENLDAFIDRMKNECRV